MMLTWLTTLVLVSAPLEPLSQAQVNAAVKTIDDRMSSLENDYQARFYIEERKKDRQAKVSQLIVYRRDSNHNLLLLFTKPKTQVGQGYLRLDKNLWYFDPRVGRWNRRTVRDAVVGGAITADFDRWALSTSYSAKYLAVEKLGGFFAHKIDLRAKPDSNTPFPISQLWIDGRSGNPLKMDARALSGELLRTTYFPKWAKVSRKGKEAVYYPKQVRIFQVSDGSETILLIQEASLVAIERGVFTKAWLESQSR